MKKSVIFILIVILLATGVLAHASPITYNPETASILEKAPNQIEISFSERVEPKASDIDVFGPGGKKIDDEAPTIKTNDPHSFKVNIRDGGPGTYTVSWHVVSADDGHFTKGAFYFSVKNETLNYVDTLTQIQIQHLTSLPETIINSIELLGLAILLGAFVILFFLVKHQKNSLSKKRFSFLIYFGAIAAIIANVSFFVLKTFDLQQLKSTAFLETLLIFLETSAGRSALGRLILILAFLTIFLIARKGIVNKNKKLEIFLFLILSAAIFLRSTISHAAASTFQPLLSVIVMFLHLFFKLALVGSVLAFLVLIIPSKNRPRDFGFFSRIMTILLGFTAISGTYIVWLHLKTFQNILTTEWGERFLLLAFLGFFLIIFRIYSCITSNEKIFSTLLTAELILGIAIIFFSSLVAITTPPILIEGYSYEQVQKSQGIGAALKPNLFDSNSMLIQLEEEASLRNLNLGIRLTNEEAGIGPIIVETDKRSDTKYSFPRDLLTPHGKWIVEATATGDKGYDSNYRFEIDYPEDILDSKIDDKKREFNLFTLVALGIVAIFLVSFFLKFPKTNRKFNYRKIAILYAIVIFAIILGLLWITHESAKTDFQKHCENRNYFWLQSAPIRNAETLSPNTVTGCTLDVGLYHFASYDEYLTFVRPTQSNAELLIGNPIAGLETDFRIRFRNPEGKPIEDLTIEHDRILHTILISEDLEIFDHIHPEDLGPITEEMLLNSEFPLSYNFPKAGKYILLIDYVVRGQYFFDNFFIEVEGNPKIDKKIHETPEDTRRQTKEFGNYRVTLTSPKIERDKFMRLKYYIEKDNAPVKDLEPYLAATMHLSVIEVNLDQFAHTHGEIFLPGTQFFQQFSRQFARNYINYHSHFVPAKFGPNIEANLLFPNKGLYKIFAEFGHEGQVILTEFFVFVE